MAEHCIPLGSKDTVCSSGTSNTSELFQRLPILHQCHKSCDSSILCAVHHLINNICLCQSVMRQCDRLIVYHYCDRSLICKRGIDQFTCQFTSDLSFREIFFLFSVNIHVSYYVLVRITCCICSRSIRIRIRLLLLSTSRKCYSCCK